MVIAARVTIAFRGRNALAHPPKAYMGKDGKQCS